MRLGKLVLGILILLLFPAARLTEPQPVSDLTLCFFRTWTGYPCPFCGLTRALGAAMRGDWHQAWHSNPLWWIAAIAMVSVAALAIGDAASGSRRLDRLHAALIRTPWPLMAVVIVVLWIITILGGHA